MGYPVRNKLWCPWSEWRFRNSNTTPADKEQTASPARTKKKKKRKKKKIRKRSVEGDEKGKQVTVKAQRSVRIRM